MTPCQKAMLFQCRKLLIKMKAEVGETPEKQKRLKRVYESFFVDSMSMPCICLHSVKIYSKMLESSQPSQPNVCNISEFGSFGRAYDVSPAGKIEDVAATYKIHHD